MHSAGFVKAYLIKSVESQYLRVACKESAALQRKGGRGGTEHRARRMHPQHHCSQT